MKHCNPSDIGPLPMIGPMYTAPSHCELPQLLQKIELYPGQGIMDKENDKNSCEVYPFTSLTMIWNC